MFRKTTSAGTSAAMTPFHFTFFLGVCAACIAIFVMILNDVFDERDRRRREEEQMIRRDLMQRRARWIDDYRP